MMRLLPSLLAVEAMRAGATPMEAAHQVDRQQISRQIVDIKIDSRYQDRESRYEDRE